MPKKTRGLARGLDALLPELDTTAPGAGQEIAIGDIDPNPDQPRRTFSEESIAQLAQSIRENGIITPITLRKTGETYQILVHSDGTYLRGELRCTAPPAHVWHISCEEEYFSREMGQWYRNNKVFRRKVDKVTGNTLEKTLLQQAHARVLYDESYIDPAKKKGC